MRNHSNTIQIGTSCVCCGDDYKTRKPTSYKDLGSKSTPIIFGMQMLSEFGAKTIKLLFCDKHGNGSLRYVTKYVNGTGVLQIKNVITNRWRNAEKLGVVV